MNTKQIAEDVLKGRKLVVLEFRKAELKETMVTENSKIPIPYVAITALSGDESVEVSQFWSRGTPRDQIKVPPYERGSRIVVEFTEYAKTKYGTRIRSTLVESVTDK